MALPSLKNLFSQVSNLFQPEQTAKTGSSDKTSWWQSFLQGSTPNLNAGQTNQLWSGVSANIKGKPPADELDEKDKKAKRAAQTPKPPPMPREIKSKKIVEPNALKLPETNVPDEKKPLFTLQFIVKEADKGLSYEELNQAVIKTILNKHGIYPSKGALEELSKEQPLDFSTTWDAKKKDYVYNPENGLMAQVKEMPLPNGKAGRGYEVAITAELEKSVLGLADKANAITMSGKKAFSELSMNERMLMAVQRSGKYFPQDASYQELTKLITPEQIGTGIVMMAGFGALAKAKIPLPPVVNVALGGLVTMDALDKLADMAIFKQICHDAKKPEDLDLAAEKFAHVAKGVGTDAMFAIFGYAAGKAAPLAGKGAWKAAEMSAEGAAYLKQAAKAGKSELSKYADELAGKMLPVPKLVTPEGIEIPLPKTPKSNNVKEMRLPDMDEQINGVPQKEDWRTKLGEGQDVDDLREVGKVEAGMRAKPQHHVFPQEYRRFFEERGFIGDKSIDKFVVTLDESTHQAIHGGSNWKLARKEWTGEWNRMVMDTLKAKEVEKGSKLTFEEIKPIVENLMKRYGIPTSYKDYRGGVK